jgi:two-component system OmpR family response regulator
MDQDTTILVVDDHKEIRELVARFLTENGLRVVVAGGGGEMRLALRRSQISLVVLDIMMPGEDGLTLCHELRQTTDLPVILLTAVAAEADKIKGLDLGADDYITKPFNPRELLARIHAVLRRASDRHRLAPDQRPTRFRFAGWLLDPASRSLTDPAGRDEPLSTAEFNLLCTLARHPGVPQSRDALLEVVAGRTANLFDRSIDNLVSRLRKRIEVDPETPQIIKTVWGRGYCLAVEVEAVP